MRSRQWRSIQSGLPESAQGSPKLVKHTLLAEVDGMSSNNDYASTGCGPTYQPNARDSKLPVSVDVLDICFG